MVCKGHLIFGVIVGHICVMALVGSDACVGYYRRQKNYCVIMWEVYRPLTVCFFKGDFCLKFIDLQWKSQCPIEEKAGMWN